MRRNIFHDKIRKQEKLSFRMTTFEDVLKYFKLYCKKYMVEIPTFS